MDTSADKKGLGVSSLAVMSLRSAIGDHYLFDAVITIEDTDFDQGLRVEKVLDIPQLVLKFDDHDAPGEGAACATQHHILSALEFARQHVDDFMLIHCHVGKCRSPGVALAIIADRMGAGREDEAVRFVLGLVPDALVNLRVLEIADDILERGGKLVAAWNAHEEKHDRLGRVRFLRSEAFRLS